MKEDTYPIEGENCRIPHQLRTTNWLVGSMVSILRQYFSSQDRMVLERATLLWNPDATLSKIQIDSVDNLKYQEGDKYPKILVDVENQTFPQDSLGDMDNFDAPTGTTGYTTRIETAFSLECWGLKKLEATAMADEIRYFLQAYRQVIATAYRFDKIRVTQVLKPVKYKQFDDYWITRAIVELNLQDTWGVAKEALEVSDFSVKVRPEIKNP